MGLVCALSKFCYLCGLLNHIERGYEKRQEVSGSLEYGGSIVLGFRLGMTNL